MSHFSIKIITTLLIMLYLRELHSSECRYNDDCHIKNRLMCQSKRSILPVSWKNDCIEMDCDCSKGDESKSPIKMTMIDKNSGKLLVNYAIVKDLTNEKETELVLRVNNEINETECYRKENQFEDIMRKTLKLKQCHSSYNHSCDEATDTVAVNFQNLHTACYQVEVRHTFNIPDDSSTDEETVVSCPKFLTTGHSKPFDHRNFKPDVACQVLDKETLHINIPPLISGYTDPEQYWTIIVDENNATNLYYPNKSGSGLLDNGMIRYHYDSLKPGNYCHGIRFMDDRCLLTYACDPKENCLWRHRIIVTRSQDMIVTKDPIVESSSFWIAVTLIPSTVLLIALIVILVLVISTMRARHIDFPTKRVEKENELLLSLVRRKILLLYPRDCSLFMEAIAQFRMVLNLNGCEVFDVWDPRLTEQIRQDPVRFVQMKVIDDETTTIVVASDCSKLICDNYNDKIRVRYKEPQEFDNLFLYGVKYIIDNFQKRCFVVRLASQHINEKSFKIKLTCLNDILEDYKLPLHLEKLILDIHSVSGVDVQLRGSEEIRQFKKLVDDYSEYKLQDPDYLFKKFISIWLNDNA